MRSMRTPVLAGALALAVLVGRAADGGGSDLGPAGVADRVGPDEDAAVMEGRAPYSKYPVTSTMRSTVVSSGCPTKAENWPLAFSETTALPERVCPAA